MKDKHLKEDLDFVKEWTNIFLEGEHSSLSAYIQYKDDDSYDKLQKDYKEVNHMMGLRAYLELLNVGAKVEGVAIQDMDWANGIIDILNELEESVPLEDVEIIRRIKKRL